MIASFGSLELSRILLPLNISLYDVSVWVLPLVIAITFHEAAHGFVAHRLGDNTAFDLGRVSFNPLRHIDPFGTLMMPAILLFSHAPFLFGYAKPVPVNFRALRSPRIDMVWVALAGPATNIALALLAAAAFHVLDYVPANYGQWLADNLKNVDEEHRHEDGDGQHHVDEARQNEHRQVEEDADREAAVDDEVDQAKRLHQPDGEAEHQADGQHHQQRLAEHIARQPTHARDYRSGHSAEPSGDCGKGGICHGRADAMPRPCRLAVRGRAWNSARLTKGQGRTGLA